MKFDKKALKNAFKCLPESHGDELLSMLNDEAYGRFYDKFMSPIEDLFFIVVFGKDYASVNDEFDCPGNTKGKKPIAWKNGFIVDHFMNYMNSRNVDKMLECVDELEKCYNDFYKERSK